MRVRHRKPYEPPTPVRPHVPALALAALPFWGASAAAYTLCRTADSTGIAILGCLLAVASLALAALAFKGRSTAILLAAAAATGALLAVGRAGQIIQATHAAAGSDVSGALCTLEQDPQKSTYGYSCLADARLANGLRCKVRLYTDACEGLVCGKTLRIESGRVQPAIGDNDSLWRSGAAAAVSVEAFSVEQGSGLPEALARLRERAISAIAAYAGNPEDAALLQALVCGWRMDLKDSQLYADFKSCGLAHIVAVSGAHLVIVTGLFAVLLRRIRLPRAPTIGVLFAVMGGYFVIAGEPVSALRACIMSMLGLLAFFGKRRASTLNAIGISIFGLIAVAPESSVSPSFALSCLSTLGIALFAPLASFWLSKTPLGHARFAVDALALTLSSMVATQPLSCALFSQLPLIGPAANIIAALLLPLACILGIACCFISLAAAPLGAALVGAACAPAHALAVCTSALSSIPHACIPAFIAPMAALAVSAGICILLYLLWPTSPRGIARFGAPLAALALAAALAYGARGERIVMLDVGQGDAFLISSGGASLLIDTGNQDSRLLAALARQGTARLDAVLITHSDDDHCGSLDAIASCVEVDTVLVARDLLGLEDGKSAALRDQAQRAAHGVAGLSYGDRVEVGGFSATVVWPHAYADGGGNADSLCLLVAYDAESDGIPEARALFTGDAESEQMGKIMAEQDLGCIDILKVGHHGSRNGLTQDQACTLSPDIALISVGENNRYGHPAPETLEMLESAGSAVFRTDADGDVSCIMNAQGITVRTQR